MFGGKSIFSFVFLALALSTNGICMEKNERTCIEKIPEPKAIRKKGMSMREMRLANEKARAEYGKRIDECFKINSEIRELERKKEMLK